MAGETVTGVTIMRVVKALDAGPMIAKATRPIDDDETSADIEQDIAQLGADLLVETVDALAGRRASETPQDESEATYAHKIEKTDGIIDWSRAARDIHNQIRGLHPWPHAYSDLQGERTILLRSEVEGEQHRPQTDPGLLDARPDPSRFRQVGVVRLLTYSSAGRRPSRPASFWLKTHRGWYQVRVFSIAS
jgi:methionyl-tRNA formyltransferase